VSISPPSTTRSEPTKCGAEGGRVKKKRACTRNTAAKGYLSGRRRSILRARLDPPGSQVHDFRADMMISMAHVARQPDSAASTKWLTLCAALILLATALAYWPAMDADFVVVDDGAYITQNEMVKKGLTSDTFNWAWTTNLSGNWQPLTLLSHTLDVSLFGLDARGHHAVNVGLHAINSLLVMLVLFHMTRWLWPSVMVALLFAVHPLRVESVAWVSERKDVLSTLFALLAMLAYIRYARLPSPARYAWTMIALVLSLLAKPMYVTLPLVLLLLDVWPLGRWRAGWLGRCNVVRDFDDDHPPFNISSPGWLVLEKVPLLLLCVASSAIAWLTQSRTGATEVLQLTFSERLANAVVSYTRYLGKTLWPNDLVFFYHHPGQWPVVAVGGAAVLLLVITAVCVATFRRLPWLLIGWLWFVGTLVPVIGLVQIGHQSIADRYMYFPQLGILFAVAWSAWVLAKRIDENSFSVLMRTAILTTAGVIAAALAVATYTQARTWRNTESLFWHALDVNPENVLVLNLMGNYLLEQGRREEAVEVWMRAAKLSPNQADLELAAFERELAINPHKPENMNNVAWYLATHYDASKRNGQRALGLALRANEITRYREPLQLDTLAAAYAEVGNFDEAVRTSQRARDEAVAAGQHQIVPGIEERLRHYQARKPFRLPKIQ
jgi:hypothetical protein